MEPKSDLDQESLPSDDTSLPADQESLPADQESLPGSDLEVISSNIPVPGLVEDEPPGLLQDGWSDDEEDLPGKDNGGQCCARNCSHTLHTECAGELKCKV